MNGAPRARSISSSVPACSRACQSVPGSPRIPSQPAPAPRQSLLLLETFLLSVHICVVLVFLFFCFFSVKDSAWREHFCTTRVSEASTPRARPTHARSPVHSPDPPTASHPAQIPAHYLHPTPAPHPEPLPKATQAHSPWPEPPPTPSLSPCPGTSPMPYPSPLHSRPPHPLATDPHVPAPPHI